MRRLIIAFPDADLAQKIKALLVSRGYPISGVCTSGAQVLQTANLFDDGGVIVSSYRFTDMSAQEIMSHLPDLFDMLVLVSPRLQGTIQGPGIYTLSQPIQASALIDSVRQLLETRQLFPSVGLYRESIRKPVKQPGGLNEHTQTGTGGSAADGSASSGAGPGGTPVAAQIGQAGSGRSDNRHTAGHSQQQEPIHGRTVEEQKIITLTKTMLMERYQMSESDAHRYLQKKSMETGIRLPDLARQVMETGFSSNDTAETPV